MLIMNSGIATLFLAFTTCSAVHQHNNLTEAPSVCPSNWILTSTKCYLVRENTKLSWEDARQYCKKHGARLAEPATYVENRRLRMSLISKQCNRGAWIGVRRGKKGEVFASNNQSVQYKLINRLGFGFTHKDEGDCVIMKCMGCEHQNCSVKSKFACEIKAEDSTTASVSITTSPPRLTTATPTKTTSTSTTTTTTATNAAATPNRLDTSSILGQAEADVVMTTVMLPLDQDAGSRGYRPVLCRLNLVLLLVIKGVMV